MRVIAPLSGIDMATENYGLFRVIMRALVSPACPEEKWKASRLALHWAYKWSEGLPCVQDPEGILAFLSYHLELADKGEDHNEPIQNALCALAYASTPETIEALRAFNPAQPSFMRDPPLRVSGHRVSRTQQGCPVIPPSHRRQIFQSF